MSLIKTVITYCLYPFLFFGAIAVAILAMELGYSKHVIVATIAIFTALIITASERINPFYTSWNKSQHDIKTDATHMGISMVILPQILDVVYVTLLLSVTLQISEMTGGTLWPNQWHLVGQLMLAMLIGGFFEYWLHRMMHEVPLFWRIHATHHSPGRLYWLNAGRFHPIDTFLSFSLATVPLMLLGAGKEVFVLVSVWIAVHGMFQHCNIKLKLGPLNYIFSMAELHRWHHSLKMEEANTNYGNNIIFWDIVFGTMFWPKERKPSEHIGLGGFKHFPTSYIGQILSPFKWKKIT